MHLDPVLPKLAFVCLLIFVVGFTLRRLRLPAVVGYLVAGIIVGPDGLALLQDEEMVSRFGAMGVVLLLFFAGLELTPSDLVKHARFTGLSTCLQITASVGATLLVGLVLDWPMHRSLLLGYVISLSSTAVVLPLLKGSSLSSVLSARVTGILLAQDVAIIPMIISLELLGGGTPDWLLLARQFAGAAGCIGLFIWLSRKGEIRLGISKWVGHDRELQVLAALIICFGTSALTGLLGLSVALGAFLAGQVIASAREIHWIHEVLEPFRVVFVVLFFLSVGMLLDLKFVAENWRSVILLSLLALLTNTFINAGVLRLFRTRVQESLLGGALLAQIGELSYVLAALGRQSEFVTEFSYQMTNAVITATLIVSPLWIGLFRWLPGRARSAESPKSAPGSS